MNLGRNVLHIKWSQITMIGDIDMYFTYLIDSWTEREISSSWFTLVELKPISQNDLARQLMSNFDNTSSASSNRDALAFGNLGKNCCS